MFVVQLTFIKTKKTNYEKIILFYFILNHLSGNYDWTTELL